MSVDTLCPTVLGCPVDTQPVVDQGSANALSRRSLQSYTREHNVQTNATKCSSGAAGASELLAGASGVVEFYALPDYSS